MSATVINLQAVREERGDGWLSGKAHCLACGHEHVAVCPRGTETLMECPACGLVKAALMYPVEPARPHWRCRCGSWVFCICASKDGRAGEVYCPNCGAVQQGWE